MTLAQLWDASESTRNPWQKMQSGVDTGELDPYVEDTFPLFKR